MRGSRVAALAGFVLGALGAGAVAVATVGGTTEAAPAAATEPPPSRPAVPAPDRVALPEPPPPAPVTEEPEPPEARIAWRRSRAEGRPDAGRLVGGVLLPAEGTAFFTWDPVRWAAPNDASRRWATDRLVRTLLQVLEAYAAANPDAARVGIGDLSRPEGGSFDARFGAVREFGRGTGSLGHVSHQNGLDADVYYPRRDRLERAPDSLADVDLGLAQDLVDRFVAAGALFVFVGPRTGLAGPPSVVQALVRHDDHLHVRLPPD